MQSNRYSSGLLSLRSEDHQRRSRCRMKRSRAAARRWHYRADHRPTQNKQYVSDAELQTERAANKQITEGDRKPKQDSPAKTNRQLPYIGQHAQRGSKLLERA